LATNGAIEVTRSAKLHFCGSPSDWIQLDARVAFGSRVEHSFPVPTQAIELVLLLQLSELFLDWVLYVSSRHW